MSEIDIQNTASNIQNIVIGGCTYEVRSFFGTKIKLEEIIAQRVLKDLNEQNREEMTCFSADEERSCSDK